MWLETVISPRLASREGRVVEPFEPFEALRPLHFGPAQRGADIEWPNGNNLRITPDANGLVFDDDTPHDSAGWPKGLAAPPAPWTEETLCVLGDALLQRGLEVGRRFTDRTESEDRRWLPLFQGHRPFGPNLRWRHGVLDTMTEGAQGDGFGFGRALALHAVCKPLRQLTLTCGDDAREVAKGLIAGGLPCLEALRLAVVTGNVKQTQNSIPLLPGFGAAFPVLKTLEVMGAPRPTPVVG